ncbi:Wadjet anti-phage system protein JetD domain-containing protein [Litoribacillus peritrichatus]|uniref:Wadjet protein JetD C-terminal domain-containing protein n=1 Tax=Litoribacillus peritrichatus TaxID=718191 RepID=A0ABP7MI95_9GAMM
MKQSLSNGQRACHSTLRRLIKRVANQVFKSDSLDPDPSLYGQSLPVTLSSVPEYFNLDTYRDREDYHATLAPLQRSKAIDVVWDRFTDSQGQIERITMIDPEQVSYFLGDPLPWVVAKQGVEKLKQIDAKRFPTLINVIDGWNSGKQPDGMKPDQVTVLLDAVKVVDYARSADQGQTILLRRLSNELFQDTKRIEALRRPIAYLVEESDPDNVFEHLGLLKHPQPMLISGPAGTQVRINNQTTQLIKPYLGIRPDPSISISGSQINTILTVENLATFNEIAECPSNPNDLLILYVAGYPTPSLIKAYCSLLQATKPKRVLHWGDTDVGGFRIAGRVAQFAQSEGYPLELFEMMTTSTSGEYKEATDKDLSHILPICDRFGWTDEAISLKENKRFHEQEFTEWNPMHIPPNVNMDSGRS